MKILICGDSFAADWTVKYSNKKGWVNYLADMYNITNLAQAGCSEYKIYKQIESVDLTKFDKIIISHTSPYRLPITFHPVHEKDVLHKNSDLLYLDVKEHAETFPELKSIVTFFEKYMDMEYALLVHELLCSRIDNHILKYHNDAIHISNIDWSRFYQFEDMLSFSNLFKNHRGDMNHFDEHGNQQVFQKVLDRLHAS